MKRIVFVCSSMGGGGAEMVAVRLSNAFSEKGYNCYYYYWDDVEKHRFPIDEDVRIIRSKGRSIFSRVNQLRQLITSENIESVISFTDIPNIVSWIALSFIKTNKPIFTSTIHSNVKVRDKNVKITVKFFLIRLLHKMSCKKANRVIAVSDGARKAVLEYYDLPLSQVHRIYNPILSSTPNSIKRSVIGEVVKLVAVGRLTEAKNYSQMIYAVKKLQDSHFNNFILDIYGEGELKSEIKSLIKNLELENIITLKGFCSNLEYRLKSYDIFLMSSKWEGFGNVLVEALALGLRIVSTNYPSGSCEILDNGKYGQLVSVGDVQSFYNAIKDAMFDNKINKGVYLYLGRFSTGKVLSEYERII
jgi:glycosyltransferase involved in cell wall biosynthesis